MMGKAVTGPVTSAEGLSFLGRLIRQSSHSSAAVSASVANTMTISKGRRSFKKEGYPAINT
eukprot:scaffold128_cov248-Pinguiococcus_pyrenoidosus.AAC.39